jgi:hypothetical protein
MLQSESRAKADRSVRPRLYQEGHGVFAGTDRRQPLHAQLELETDRSLHKFEQNNRTEVNRRAKNGRIFFSEKEEYGMDLAERKAKYPLVGKLQSDPGNSQKNELARRNGHGKGAGTARMGYESINQGSRAEHHRAYSRCVLQTIQAKPSSIRTPPNMPINPTYYSKLDLRAARSNGRFMESMDCNYSLA